MKTLISLLVISSLIIILSTSFEQSDSNNYLKLYNKELINFDEVLNDLKVSIQKNELYSEEKEVNQSIIDNLYKARLQMKSIDIWLRYLNPIAYKKVNAPLPVEWEVEVFEKFEPPYERIGAGLTLAETFLDEGGSDKVELVELIEDAIGILDSYTADSIYSDVKIHHHFILANRLFLLNLAAIYTTGFECPNRDNILPELKAMLSGTKRIYMAYNSTYATYPLSSKYLELYESAISYVDSQPNDIELFDHFTFIKVYINPLFGFNQQMIRSYKIKSNNFNDYSLNDDVNSIFNKHLYQGQAVKGVYASIKDESILNEIRAIGKILFFDPILSGNNKRSCASCHDPNQFFTDTSMITHLHFNQRDGLLRNTPSLVNSVHNHLLMHDGKHFNLQSQAIDVITNPDEMNSEAADLVEKVLDCKDYKKAFQKFSKYGYADKEISIDHIASALSIFFSDFSFSNAPFDFAINENIELSQNVVDGFNLFMGRTQCATCHFVPQFNGVKPPYIGSEFEVIGVPNDTSFSEISTDNGRYDVHNAGEMFKAIKTGSLRNSMHTQPYMHNGVFATMEEVIDFYNNGGGLGHGILIENQTLPSDSLNLSEAEKASLISFLSSLTENIEPVEPPIALPNSCNKDLNNRVVGGIY